MKVTLGSLFDGIGGFPLAAKRNGITPVWASEIEKYCVLITKIRFPDMLHLGDITEINGKTIEPVDIISMGSPCQDLSIAGKQQGLTGERSGLFFEGIRIVREMQEATNGKYPRFLVWENVNGAIYSNKGYDFRTVLEEISKTDIPMPNSGKWAGAGMVRSDKCEIAWRILNAQYFGVPQRRKRIYLVADFGGDCAGKILFDAKSVCGDSSEILPKTDNASARIKNSVEETGNIKDLKLFDTNYIGVDGIREYNDGVAPCVLQEYGAGGNHVPLVTYCISGNIIDRKVKNGGNHLGIKKDIAFTLDTHYPHAVAYGIGRDAFNQGRNGKFGISINKEVQPTLVAKGVGAVMANEVVRRLTPLECERLQGFPDNWTKTNHNLCVDSTRFRIIGNSIAIPCADYVFARMIKYGFEKSQEFP